MRQWSLRGIVHRLFFFLLFRFAKFLAGDSGVSPSRFRTLRNSGGGRIIKLVSAVCPDCRQRCHRSLCY